MAKERKITVVVADEAKCSYDVGSAADLGFLAEDTKAAEFKFEAHPVEQEHSEYEVGDAGQWEFLRPERKQVRMPVTLERGHELVAELVNCRNLKTNLEGELEDCKKMAKGLKEQIAYQEQKIGINIDILDEGELQLVDVEVFGDFGARMVEVRDVEGEVLESRAMTALELQRELPLEEEGEGEGDEGEGVIEVEEVEEEDAA